MDTLPDPEAPEENAEALLARWREGSERSAAELRLAALPLPSLLEFARRALGRERRVLATAIGARCARLAESPSRENADALRSLIEGDAAAGLWDQSGRSCRAAAAEALLSMGYPYALEISPEALAALREEQGGRPRRFRSAFWPWGVLLAGALLLLALSLLGVGLHLDRGVRQLQSSVSALD